MDLKKKSLMFIFFTAVISGVAIFVNSFGVKGFDSSVFTFSKNIVVALLLLAILVGVKEFNVLKNLKRKQWTQLAFIGLIGGSIPFLLFFRGLQLTTGTTSAFVHKTLFIFVAIFALLTIKEKPTKGFIAGAIFLLAGTYFIIRPDFTFANAHLFVLGATILWAAENVLSKHVLEDLSGNIVAFGRMFFGSLFIFGFLTFTGKAPLVVAMNNAQYMWIAVTSVFLLLFVFTYYNGLKHVKVSTAASILALGAPITSVLALLFKGVSIGIFQAAGMLTLVIGVVLIVWSENIFRIIQGQKWTELN